MASPGCTFCGIVAGTQPANIRYEDDRVIVFDNRLDWVPVMLLLAPKSHMSQPDLWADAELLSHIGTLAARLGAKHCPNGFRILSNFGQDGLQTQPHAHMHVIGGTRLGRYVTRGWP